MKYLYNTLIFSTLISLSGVAQTNLTGVWRGSFYNIREVMLGGSKYRYEVQIDNKGQAVRGVTYSYQTTRFYGKANMIGKWSPESSNLILMEDKMLDMKIEGGGEGCLMTCYLEYRREGDNEYLEGTYTSKNMNNGTDCGGGRVRLEKVPDSDFEKEDFLKTPAKPGSNAGKVKPGQEDYLVKRPATPTDNKARNSSPAKTPPPANATKPKTPPPPASGTKPKTPPPATGNTAKNNTTKPPANNPERNTGSNTPKATPPAKPKNDTPKPTEVIPNRVPEVTVKAEPKKPTVPKPAPPPVLKNRSNELFETITTDAREIVISFYDNGEIDGDTISVYDNNRLLVSKKGLSASPIEVKIRLNEEEPDHEIVMVAENLGSIPPNTALMIVQAGSKRYTLRLSSTEQKNAMVRFRYEPKIP